MTKKININKNILSENDQLAVNIHNQLAKHHIFSLNVMASPGAGKTSFIIQTIKALQTEYQVAVIDGDVSDIDVKKLRQYKIPVVLANTGGACHLDATMMHLAVGKLSLEDLDLLIVENVGNLICPANFTLGTDKNIVIASVPEGDDKPYKYPGMFIGADVVILNKIDYLEHEAFDMSFFESGLHHVNPGTKLIPVSCRSGQGLKDWISWLRPNIHVIN